MIESIQYGKDRIEFELKYSKRKSVGVKILPDSSVVVSAPMEVPMDRIKELLLKKASWIIKQKSFFLQFESTIFDYEVKSGYSIYYLGRQYKFTVEKSYKEEVSYKGNLFLVSTRSKDRARDLFLEWLKIKAANKITEIAKPIIKKFSERFEAPKSIYFQDMPTRWGSCTVNNKLIFNPKLVHTPKRCIEYVVMHELCHIVNKHHDQNFFDLLTVMMPDWERRKAKLDSFA
ncbi:M48 family metallopeptidase [Chryseobacterium sp. KMC2]|uniref:M48 family metallopeptidase n=1 Tax=Chryseobacterium sp. KMC2 TaxID=2800705 RepID=UPI0019204E56|nr:SprT family zinc-dependent metalloprotease [Chryseobacterium sp. KMC2]MBL3548862.1 M48 family metallopeptidase [Chryseobacterium sp. KMC2]